MKLAILTCGILPIPAVQGGAVENLIDFYLAYNDRNKIHDITIYSPWDAQVKYRPEITSSVNHYIYTDVTSLWARTERRIYKYLHTNEYYNYFIEYYFEKVFADLKKRDFDCIILENCPGFVYKLSQRGYKNLVLHLHNDLLNANTRYHETIFNGLTKIITVSDYVKKRVSTIQLSDKIQTIYNGIDLSMFSTKDMTSINREKVGFSANDFVIVYSGRINQEKGISELIDAMLQLKDNPQIKLLVLGSTFFNDSNCDNDFSRLLKEKAKSIKERIVFTGFIPYHQVPNYLQLADMAVLPSMWEEPFGLTIVEALAAGLPLITTRSGGIPEICEGVACIVNRDNVVNGLTSAIHDLYEHPEKREQMAKASIDRAKLFDKDTFCQKFFNALEDL